MANNRNTKNMLSLTDYCFSFSVEKRKENGEDCVSYAYHRDAAFFGAFDGCGGAGSQSCPRFGGKSEAYVAARVTADAFRDWFDLSDGAPPRDVGRLREHIFRYLSEADALVGEKSMLVGGLRKKFPTTAACGICYPGKRGVEADLFWAGDSRVYLLTPQGLAQLTEDDLGGIDAMQNLTEDAPMTNMISLSKNFVIHTGHIAIPLPAIIFAATDGCFGYLSTPMEFEYMLLETMLNAKSVSGGAPGAEPTGWMELLSRRIGKVAGDDYTICGYAIGFDSFQNQKNAFVPRTNMIYNRYIRDLPKKSYQEKLAMWQEYRGGYHRMLCRP